MSGRPETETLRWGIEEMRRRLPAGWTITRANDGPERPSGVRGDAIAELLAPDRTATVLILAVKTDGSPRATRAALDRLLDAPTNGVPVLIAPFLPPASRKLAEAAGVNYVDLTGNVRLELPRPALFLRDTGATKNPFPTKGPRRTLGGAAAGRVVLRLCELEPPFSSSTLTEISGVSLPYVSRLIDLLESEDLVRRRRRGPIEAVDRPGIVRRWAQDYDLLRSNRGRAYLDPRGAAAALSRIGTKEFQAGITGKCAVSGSFAANRWAPVASPSKLLCFVDDPDQASSLLDLAPASRAGNVFLLAPYDPIVYEILAPPLSHPDWPLKVPCAAPAQVAVDCLTGPDRMPVEGEALLEWLQRTQPLWRAFVHEGRP